MDSTIDKRSEPATMFSAPKGASIARLKKENLERLDWRDLFKEDGVASLPKEDSEAMDEYFRQFLKPGQGCVSCGKKQSGGDNIIDQFLDSHFTWGMANGEGFCSNCKYPARAYHRSVGPIKFLNMILQYHPAELGEER